MSKTKREPIKSNTPTMCAVCAWRADCKKKYSYEQGSVIKCADFTRDMAKPAKEESAS